MKTTSKKELLNWNEGTMKVLEELVLAQVIVILMIYTKKLGVSQQIYIKLKDQYRDGAHGGLNTVKSRVKELA